MYNYPIKYKKVYNKNNNKYIIFLHGWGVSKEIFNEYINALSNKYNIVAIDFNGFGQSIDPKPFFDTYEYALQVYLLLKSKNICNENVELNIIAHSFGGRVAIILASLFQLKINNIILTGSAGLKPKYSIKYYYKIYKYKLLKALKYKKISNFGSVDYNTAKSIMQTILVKVVNQHLNYLVKNIDVPILLIWGSKDDQTPLYMCRYFRKHLEYNKCVILDGGTHFCFFTHSYICINKVKEFLRE